MPTSSTRWGLILLPLPPILIGVALVLTGNSWAQAAGVACILLSMSIPFVQYRLLADRARLRLRAEEDGRRMRAEHDRQRAQSGPPPGRTTVARSAAIEGPQG
jgi:hypothetical protein